MPIVSSSYWLWIAVDASIWMFGAEQGFVPFVYGIGVICAIPAGMVIGTTF